MKLVLAVSGGVDSVVLLHMIMQRLPASQVSVAHFDHGIREDSAADSRFVAGLAALYGVDFMLKREELGSRASEQHARQRRYEFLKSVARTQNAVLVTAHHQDDLIETIAINLQRGTGWRGLAVFGDRTILRPLIGRTKRDVYRYALRHDLEWVEDETNNDTTYLRNRIRSQTQRLTKTSKQSLRELWSAQRHLGYQIDQEIVRTTPAGSLSRYEFIMTPEPVALERLRWLTQSRLTRPQLERALLAIKTARAGSRHEAGDRIVLVIGQRDVTITNTGELV